VLKTSGGNAKPTRKSLDDSLAGVAQRAQQSKEKIRVEGFALGSDKDRVNESLKRANQVRDRLVQNGLPAEQIEVIGTGRAAQGDAVRIMAIQGEANNPISPPNPASLPPTSRSAAPSSCRACRSRSKRVNRRWSAC
jgi:hypothetical protein